MLPVNYNKQTSVSYQTVSMLIIIIIINNVRWQYHVKDIAWAPYKITQTKQTKGQRRWQSVVTGRQQLAVQYNHDRLVIVKWRPKKYSLQLTMERCQWPCISDRWWRAVPRTCLSHREGTIAKRWVSGGQYDQHGCVSRTQTALSIDIRCPEKTPQQGTSALFHEDSGRPERTAGMWLVPELATNGAHEAMGLCVLTASLRKQNERRH